MWLLNDCVMYTHDVTPSRGREEGRGGKRRGERRRGEEERGGKRGRGERGSGEDNKTKVITCSQESSLTFHLL